MARYPSARKIYEVADLFQKRCLQSETSFLWPSEPSWTIENLKSFWDAFAGHPDESPESFITKWSRQLADQPDDVIRIATDIAAFYTLYPTIDVFGPDAKIDLIESVRAMRPEISAPDNGSIELLKDALQPGVGNPGMHYLTGRPYHMALYIGFAWKLKEMAGEGISASDPLACKAVADEAKGMVKEAFGQTPGIGRNILLHLLFPDEFERIATDGVKKRIVSSFRREAHVEDEIDVDDALSEIRTFIASTVGAQDFDFYDRSIRPLWDDEASTVYQAADLFRERCLENGESFLWPGQRIYTPEILEQFLHAFSVERSKDLTTFMDKLRAQFIVESKDVQKILADAMAFLYLFPSTSSISKATKLSNIERALEWSDLESPDEETWALLQRGFAPGIGSPGTLFSTAFPYQVAFIGLLLRHIQSINTVPASPQALNDASRHVLDEAKRTSWITRSVVPARHITLHLLFPEEFEPIASDSDKAAIVKRLGPIAGVDPADDIDFKLKVIRADLIAKGARPDFSFYDKYIRDQWSGDSTSTEPVVPPSPPLSPSGLSLLAHSVYMNEGALEEIDDLLSTKRQLIFEGPPGSGKTYVAEKFARWFTGQALDGEPLNERVEIVQFHQSYGYEDFVQGIRPETNDDGQLVYQVRDGIFLDMCERAKSNPEERFVLIIDEINRGNLSRIFGELLLLLEYRNQSVRLPYGSGDAAYLTIPENLYLIGTMNTADRSLAQIDYALRRRFYFVRFMPVEDGKAGVFANWLAANERIGDSEKRRLLRLFINLNEGIREHLHTDDLQVGHSYFMQPGIETPVVFNRVWRRAVRPLLEEYLHHHRNRDDILAALTPDALVTPGSEPHEAVDGKQSRDDSATEP
jgi:5-methylcytosine-specific restriction enzyme B